MTTSAHSPIWTDQEPHQIALDALQQFHWSVFPLDEEKRPPRMNSSDTHAHPKRLSWKALQTRLASPNELLYWQKTYQPSAWAIITGTISHIVLLDFDGEAGQQTRAQLGLTNPHVQTGSGGHHVYFRHPGWSVPTLNCKTTSELGQRWPGLDIRADGGYAAFCGRNTQGPYRWLRYPESEALTLLPTDLRRFLGLLEPPDVRMTVTSSLSRIAEKTTEEPPRVSAHTLLTRALRLIRDEGKGRNDAGFWLACQLRDNAYTLDAAKATLSEYVRQVPAHNTKGHLEPYTLEDAYASLTSAFHTAPRSAWELAPGQQGSTNESTHREASSSVRAAVPLPEILITDKQLRDAVDQAIAAIMQKEQETPSLFIQSTRLVRVGQNKQGRPLLTQMGGTEIREMLTHCADFFRLRKGTGSESELEKVAASPPKELAEQILARQAQAPYLPFPSLTAIVETPVIRPDGTVLDRPGYDPATQLYYMPSARMEACTIPLAPTPQECSHALALLWSAIGEFPYASDADKANALGLLLTPIVRPAIVRHVALALIDAPKQGTGKGLLSDVVSIIATGTSAAILTMSNNDDELQKSITALLLEGAAMITIDNITGRLQSRHLDAVLTSDMWRGRILGLSKMALVPQRATWIATGNNIKLGGDLDRRCYRIRLDAKVSRPFLRRDFTHKDLVSWVTEHRVDLVAALLTLARAWYAAGCPEYLHLPSLGTFSGWVKTVGGILELAGVQGFLSNLEQLYTEVDEEGTEWEGFLYAWHQVFGNEWVPLAQVVRQISLAHDAGVHDENAEGRLAETLPEMLQMALKEKPQTFSLRLANALRKRVDTCFGNDNLHLEKKQNSFTNTGVWRVWQESAGVAGVPGVVSATTHMSSQNIAGVTGVAGVPGVVLATTHMSSQNAKGNCERENQSEVGLKQPRQPRQLRKTPADQSEQNDSTSLESASTPLAAPENAPTQLQQTPAEQPGQNDSSTPPPIAAPVWRRVYDDIPPIHPIVGEYETFEL